MSIRHTYSGMRVLDPGQGVAAPYCGMLLAMHGAESWLERLRAALFLPEAL